MPLGKLLTELITVISPNSYKASIFTWNIRYNCPIWFCEKKESPEIIHKILHYEVSEYLKGLIK